SPMSLGSRALSGLSVFPMAEGALQLLSGLRGVEAFPSLRRITGIVGLPFSIFLSGYSGILLAATNIPLWWRAFPLLSPTFVSSAYSATLAALSVMLQVGGHEDRDTAHRQARAETICLVSELTWLTLILLRLGAIGRPLRAGKVGRYFW